MDKPTTPSPWAHLRRTRGALISTAVLLGLWLLLILLLPFAVARAMPGTWGDTVWLTLALTGGFIVSHAFVGWRLVRLIKAAGEPDMEASPQTAARAFVAFWKTNLEAHALLWGWFLFLLLLAAKTFR